MVGDDRRVDDAVDIATLQRISARDQSAVSDLYDRHSRLLFSLISRIVHDRAEAEEVLQEVFLSVWTKVHTYDPKLGSPIGWLVRLARNRAIDRFRALAARTRAVEAMDEPHLGDNPEEATVRNQERSRIRHALEALPGEQRQLIEQAYFRGLTHSELAKAFGLPLGTVKTRVRSGMQALRAQLGVAIVSR